MTNDDMARAHHSDTQDERRMKDLLLVLRDFLDDPPDRCRERTRQHLRGTVRWLERDCAHIVAVWD